MSRTPRTRPDACSVLWDDDALPAWGSAAVATCWVGLEQDGPWGHDPVVDSRLDPALGRELAAAAQGAGGRLLLLRRPGAHPDAPDAARTVLVAGALGTTPWLVRAPVTDPAVLRALPWADLATGGPDAVVAAIGGAVDPEPHLLVCTNGRRDVCCATRGRPVVLAAHAERPGQVWECSHTGGHRFAPTGVVLPSGQTLARLDADTAVRALDDAARGLLVAGPRHDRGCSHLDPLVQAAHAWARHEHDARRGDDVVPGTPYADGPGVLVPLRVRGEQVLVRVERVLTGDERRDSCAKGLVPSSVWRVTPA